jgi:hypothetical protein
MRRGKEGDVERMSECTRADDESPIPKSPSAAVSLPCISEAVPYPLAAISLSGNCFLYNNGIKSYCPKVGGTYAIVDSWKEHMSKTAHNARSFLPADSVVG